MEKIKSNKKSLLILGTVLIIALFVFAGLIFYFSRKTQTPEAKAPAKPTQEEIIKSLTVPAGPSKPVPKEVLKNLSAPSGNKAQKKISEDILKSLSAPK